MYARVITFVLGPDTQWEADRMADIAYLRAKLQNGFVDSIFLHDYENGRYQWISYWETSESLERSFQQLYPLFQETVGHRYQWEPSVQVLSVYEPRG